MNIKKKRYLKKKGPCRGDWRVASRRGCSGFRAALWGLVRNYLGWRKVKPSESMQVASQPRGHTPSKTHTLCGRVPLSMDWTGWLASDEWNSAAMMDFSSETGAQRPWLPPQMSSLVLSLTSTAAYEVAWAVRNQVHIHETAAGAPAPAKPLGNCSPESSVTTSKEATTGTHS